MLRGALISDGWSDVLVLSQAMAAPVVWCSSWLWLLHFYGALDNHGCSGGLALSIHLAAQVFWRSPWFWLLWRRGALY